jgi:hypothetical protein
MVFSLVSEDDVNFFGARATNVGTEHDVVRGVTVHTGLVQIRCEHFDISTTAINVLLVFYLELDNEVFSLIAE